MRVYRQLRVLRLVPAGTGADAGLALFQIGGERLHVVVVLGEEGGELVALLQREPHAGHAGVDDLQLAARIRHAEIDLVGICALAAVRLQHRGATMKSPGARWTDPVTFSVCPE